MIKFIYDFPPYKTINMAIRKILSAEELEAKDKRNKKIIVIILGIIMIFSSLSYAFLTFEKGDNGTSTISKKISYRGVNFLQTQSGNWDFNISGYGFETKYTPEETLNISAILTKTMQSYSNLPLYFGIDNLEELNTAGNSEIINNIGNFVLKYQESCLTNNCTENLPIKNCSADNVIIFKQSETSSIYEDEKCVYIQYANNDEIRAADAFVFKIIGIR